MSDDVLLLALQVAVPLRMAELSRMTPYQRAGAIAVWREHGEEVVAYEGDHLLVAHPQARGDSAKAFNRMARGLAAMAYAPGGVSFAGLHWCADNPLTPSLADGFGFGKTDGGQLEIPLAGGQS